MLRGEGDSARSAEIEKDEAAYNRFREKLDVVRAIMTSKSEQAKAEAAKVIADAYAAIETKKMAALTDVKNQIGTMVIEISEKVIRKQLDNKSEQEKYIQQMAGELHQFGK